MLKDAELCHYTPITENIQIPYIILVMQNEYNLLSKNPKNWALDSITREYT